MSRVLRGHRFFVGFPMFLQETQHLEARRVGESTAPDPINPLPHGSPPLIAADWLVRGTESLSVIYCEWVWNEMSRNSPNLGGLTYHSRVPDGENNRLCHLYAETNSSVKHMNTAREPRRMNTSQN